MAKKKIVKKAKRKPARKPKPDVSQTALSIVEKVIGGKLVPKKRR